jgi:hypothetical protein
VGDDFERLVRLFKIRTILKLNYEDEGSDAAAAVPVIQIPMPPRDLAQSFIVAADACVARALVALCDPNHWPIFVHCTHGQDRTGLLVGEFRVRMQGWSITQAWDEMIRQGYHWELIDLSRAWMRFCEDTRQSAAGSD